MTHPRRYLLACCLTTFAVALAGPVAGASASRASIKAALKSYSGRIAVVEGHTLTAVGEYKSTHNAAPVEEAITKSVGVLSALAQSVRADGVSSSSRIRASSWAASAP
jgi:hypothetical protein